VTHAYPRWDGDVAGAFIERIEGSYSNVVGLPLLETIRLLEKAGVELPWT